MSLCPLQCCGTGGNASHSTQLWGEEGAVPGGGNDVSKRARAVNPSEMVADAGNFAAGAGTAAACGTVRGCRGEGWAMDAELVGAAAALPAPRLRRECGRKVVFLH